MTCRIAKKKKTKNKTHKMGKREREWVAMGGGGVQKRGAGFYGE
jgi:hypothetical protein